MTWNYSGDPSKTPRDEVRYLVGDTCKEKGLVSDEEIAYSLSKFPDSSLAAALVLRALAAKFSRAVSSSVDGVSKNCSDLAKQFREQAEILDPEGVTAVALVLPSFGGLSKSQKADWNDDLDAVQPSFSKGQDDIPGGPSNVHNSLFGCDV